MPYEVEVDYRGKVTVIVDATDRDEAAEKATERVCNMDIGGLDKKEFDVTGTFAEGMTAYDIKEMKVAHLI